MADNQIYNYIERISELLKVDARQAGAESGLQPVQLEVLHYLQLCNRYSDTAMAVSEYLGQTKGTVSQTLKVLEKKGLLYKQPDTADKRIAHLKLTDAGEQLLAQLIPTPVFAQACAALPAEQRQVTEQALKVLLQSVLQTNGMRSFGICKSCRYNRQLSDGEYFCDLVQVPLSEEDVQLICREHEVKCAAE